MLSNIPPQTVACVSETQTEVGKCQFNTVTISVLNQATILDFCKQNTNEALKMKKK